jgi:hypothetical protein
MGRLLAAGLAVLVVLGAPGASRAAWSQPGVGVQSAKALSMPSGSTPTASVSNRSVTVSWAQRTVGGSPVAGYVVKRYDGSGTAQTVGSGCSGTIAALTCTETGVPGGSWRYTVAPKQNNWTGSESSQSSAVSVSSPSLSFSSSTTVTSLPSTLSGTLSSFISGETVTFRLDDPASGTVLTSTVTPSTIPSGGGASFSVTVPSGTASGSHTVYAIGSSGDQVSGSITVSVPVTITTSAWDLRDGSSGTLANVSAQPAFAGDALTFNSGSFGTTFSTSRYIEFDANDSLAPGQTVTNANFNFTRAATTAGDTICFYFEVRHASTGTQFGTTHGNSVTPAGCSTGTTQTTTSTALPELTTSDLADDARIRLFATSSASGPIVIDRATITGTSGSTPFTLYTTKYTENAAGTTPTTTPWYIGLIDASYYESATNWPTSFTSTQYLRVTFPSYVPSSATMQSATLSNTWRPTNSANTACWYADVYSGGLLIAQHGNSASPIGCTTGTSFATSSTPLNEVNTPTRANDLTVRIYERVSNGGSRRAQTDQIKLSLTYTP